MHVNERVTAKSSYKGIHPLEALESHQEQLGSLVQRALGKWRDRSVAIESNGNSQHVPDFVSVTRGPGMRSNLSVGLELAKGLSLAWRVPLIGVHHMQAHLLTPRLVSATSPESSDGPDFPFLSLLVSGGHTMLVSSLSITDHTVVASTADIAIGNMLDRVARLALPADHETFTGPALERFAFPDGSHATWYGSRHADSQPKWSWRITPPLSVGRGGRSTKRLEYSFTGLASIVERAITSDTSIDERVDLARQVQKVAFEHLASRCILYLDSMTAVQIETLVVAGGVAANSFLRHVLRTKLDQHGYTQIDLSVPPIELCTDNAAMIAWTGLEMWSVGLVNDYNIRPRKQWILDEHTFDDSVPCHAVE